MIHTLNVISSVTTQLHESLILEYGSVLMGHYSLWQCGVSYLEHCALQGLPRLKTLLQSIPLGTEVKISKIIELARYHKMHKVGKYTSSRNCGSM